MRTKTRCYGRLLEAESAAGVRDTEVEEPRCARQSRERKRAVAGTSSEIAGCDPSPPLSYVRGSACRAPKLGFARLADASRNLPLLRRAPARRPALVFWVAI